MEETLSLFILLILASMAATPILVILKRKYGKPNTKKAIIKDFTDIKGILFSGKFILGIILLLGFILWYYVDTHTKCNSTGYFDCAFPGVLAILLGILIVPLYFILVYWKSWGKYGIILWIIWFIYVVTH